MAEGKPDLAGIYVTDDALDLVVGKKQRTDGRAPLVVEILDDRRVEFGGDQSLKRTEAAFAEAIEWVQDNTESLRSIGIAGYGPFWTVDPKERGRSLYGKLHKTTHGRLSEQSLYDLVQVNLKSSAAPPLITVETDVNAAAMGELVLRWTTDDGEWREGHDKEIIVFIKVSKGVGGGVVYGSDPMFWMGRKHPEMGQIRAARWQPSAHDYDAETLNDLIKQEAQTPGVCPYHGDCIEGLTCVDAIREFSRSSWSTIASDAAHPVWDREAFYLAQLCVAVTCLIVPSQIILGGRVMHVKGLTGKVREQFRALMGKIGHLPYYPDIRKPNYITENSLRTKDFAGRPGAIGAICLASKFAADANRDDPTL